MCYWNGDERSASWALRPVITLKPNLKIDVSNPGDGTENKPFNIK